MKMYEREWFGVGSRKIRLRRNAILVRSRRKQTPTRRVVNNNTGRSGNTVKVMATVAQWTYQFIAAARNQLK
jgi:hypothetical protein